MKKHLVTALALALALVSLVPGLAAAKIAGNRNQTLLCVAGLLAFAFVSLLPGLAGARLAGNHNQTLLRQ